MGMLKIIELHAFDDETLVQKFDMKDNVIKKGLRLPCAKVKWLHFATKVKRRMSSGRERINSIPTVCLL